MEIIETMINKVAVCIVGAGPGGVATALQLNKLGVDCMLLDKATFPRDKVCGDALSGKVITMLKRIDPKIINNFALAKQKQIDSWGIRFIAPNLKHINVPFRYKFDKQKDAPPGYISKRIDFDNYLVEQLKGREHINFQEGINIVHYEKKGEVYHLSNKDKSFQVATKMLIVANGAQSQFTRKVAKFEKDPDHYCAGIRAYYKGVKGMDTNNFIELHFLKDFLPGYLWIFPLANGEANVGVGMLSSAISKKKVNLKEEMLHLIETHPSLKDRFENAELIDKIRGYGLPLGSKKRKISGDNYLLVGDAAHLIDPFTGEGIGNAIYSGVYAANQAKRSIEKNDFSAKCVSQYDIDIQRVLGQELRLSRKLQKMLNYPWLFNIFAFLASKNRKLSEAMTTMFLDMDLRDELMKPSFYFKLLFFRK